MAGMMPQDATEQQAAPAAPAQDPQQDQPQAANDNSASPEEQQQYNQFVGRAMELINGMFDQIVEMLRGGGEEGQSAEDHGANGPGKGLAQTTVMVLAKVGSAAEQAGQTLSPDVVFHGGSEIFSQLAEISDKAGISDYANDRDALEAAYYLTIDMATEQMAQSGELDQEGAKAAMQQLIDMDAKGELQQIFQSLDAKDQGGAAPAGKPAGQPQPGGMMPKEA